MHIQFGQQRLDDRGSLARRRALCVDRDRNFDRRSIAQTDRYRVGALLQLDHATWAAKDDIRGGLGGACQRLHQVGVTDRRSQRGPAKVAAGQPG